MMIGDAESLAFAAGKPEAERAIARTARRQLHLVLIGALRWDSSRERRPSPFS